MNILLIYYTGTFNTKYLVDVAKDIFEKDNHHVDTFEVTYFNYKNRIDLLSYDLIGFAYPIYGFNIPMILNHFIKRQIYPKKARYFVFKNSGETLAANSASSLTIYKTLRHQGLKLDNEYHFVMPYNIHFRFDEPLIKEMLTYDRKLIEIMHYEITNNINNFKKYKFIYKFVNYVVRIQYIGGPINSFLFRVDKNKCIDCDLCIKMCPSKNIYKKNNNIKFHHHCLMCMRCSLFCPKDAFFIGFLNGWKVNKPYDFKTISKIENKAPIISKSTKGFFKCYIKTFNDIENRYSELFKK